MAHTPGPWKAGNVDNQRGGQSAVLIWAEGGDDLGEARTFADARLMAAAPELLEALQYLMSQTIEMDEKYGVALSEGEHEAALLARAAIAKAKGN